ncbi:hypothetical protein QQS21_010479 [Conoideocrella luteorostrata]|uniref:Amidase domain-containing protein n=1 Tax=Conoideocrella luteorostrata TaxID=1105319 RepID=A0AAJ0FWU4_9HYPO|nr:hypothetical protein QQS21_010479 [Conoideocrella luteorostrata]
MLGKTSFFLLALIAGLATSWLNRDRHLPQHIPPYVDLLSMTARDIASLLENNTFTSLEVVNEYVRRIKLDDRSGLGLHSILELTPLSTLVGIAKQRDLERQCGLIRSPLHGIPLIVKRNMATDASLFIKTSSSAFALRNATAVHDAHIVAKEREAGLIIIGKANLGELNGFKKVAELAIPLATRSLLTSFHPCGSSARSTTAVTAGFTPLALRAETQGSISYPASFTTLYGLTTSTGLLSRSGILPSSTTFDSPGILAKSPWDVAALLTEIDGVDPRDPITIESKPFRLNFTHHLDASWRDFRIGVADKEWFWSIFPGFFGDKEDLKDEEKSLSDLVEFNKNNSASSQSKAQAYLEAAINQHLSPEEYKDALLEARRTGLEEGIVETLDSYNLDVLVLPAWTGMSIYATWAQAPTATVPLGKYRHGKPYGLGFVARLFDDGKFLQIMHFYEKTFPRRAVPHRMRVKIWQSFLPRKYLGSF